MNSVWSLEYLRKNGNVAFDRKKKQLLMPGLGHNDHGAVFFETVHFPEGHGTYHKRNK